MKLSVDSVVEKKRESTGGITGRDVPNLDISATVQDKVGPGDVKFHFRNSCAKCDHASARGFARVDSCRRILQHDTVGCGKAQSRCCFQKGLCDRFSVGHIARSDQMLGDGQPGDSQAHFR